MEGIIQAAQQVNGSTGNGLTADAHQARDQLFLAMAEALKLPLQHIARQAELQQMTVAEADPGLRDIQASAGMSLQLLDSYLLSLRLSLQSHAEGLQLAPVSLSAVLHDTIAELSHTAASYGVELRLHVRARYEPVLADRQALQAALIALGYAVIEALPSNGTGGRCLQLATHRTNQGIVAGIYGDLEGLTPHAYRRAGQLQGRVRQPLVAAMPGSAAGVFVADAILTAMQSRLRVGRYMKLPGFAVTLPASEQLQLV